MVSMFKKTAVAAVAAVLGLGAVQSASAATILKSGDMVGGWKVSFPTGISLTFDGISNGTIDLEKQAAFTSTEGLVITFTQVSNTAAPKISFVNEALTNLGTKTWSGFQFLSLNTLVGNAADTTFLSPSDVFTPNADSHFTTVSYTPSTVTYGGGTVDPTDTAEFGFGNAGDLVIDAQPATDGCHKVFNFKEMPLVPLPAASWSALSGLLGLGVIGYGRNLKKILA